MEGDEEEYNDDLGNDCDDEIDCEEEESFHRNRLYMDIAARLEEKMMQPGVRLTNDEREEAELHAALVKHFELNQMHMSISGHEIWQTDFRRDIANSIFYKYRLGRDTLNKQNLLSDKNLKKMADEEIKQDMAEENETKPEGIDREAIVDALKDLPTVCLNNIQMKVLKIVPENLLYLLQLQFYDVLSVDYSLKGSDKEINPFLMSKMGDKLIKMVKLESVSMDDSRFYHDDEDPDIGDYLLIDTYFNESELDPDEDFSLPRFYHFTESYFNRYFGKLKKQKVETDKFIEVENTTPQSNQGGFSWL